MRGGALADPVLEHGGGEAPELGASSSPADRPRRRRGRGASPRPSRPRTRRRGRRARCASAADRSGSAPKAERWAAWWIACATPARIAGGAPITQSRRVWLTISMIVGTPRPSSPTCAAQAPSNSISLEALERLPSLSLSRWMWKRLRSPSGVQRGTGSRRCPPSVWARTRKASHIGAEQNHLWPVSSYSAPGPPPFSGVARGGVGAHVGAALLLGHRHAAEGAASCARRAASARRSRARGSAAPTRRRARAAVRSAGIAE